MMKIFRFTLLIGFAFGLNFGYGQTPVAGFSLDSVITSSSSTGFLIFFTDMSSGNPSSKRFIVHDPGDITFQYQVFPNGTFGTFLPFTNHPGATVCGAFEISQIVTNNFGSDTASVVQNIGCSCLSTPLNYWLDVTYSGNGNISFNAGTNEDSWDCLIYAQGMGNILGCPSSGFSCTSILPGPGTYDFCARFDNGTCTSNSPAVTCTTTVISCGGSPQVSIGHSAQLNTVGFSSQVSAWPAATYQWDFGDGNSSGQPTPSHTYAAAGTYLACLTVSDTCGQTSVCDTVVVTCPVLSPQFSQTVNQLQASFFNTSTAQPGTAYSWDFGDGNSSTTQSPSHTYSSPGTYVVCLSLNDGCNLPASHCDTIQITCPGLSVLFADSSNFLQASFTNQSLAAPGASYLWDFGDGNSSTQQSPSHTYSSPGTYLVCLTIDDGCNAPGTYCDTLLIVCPLPVSGFSSTSSWLQASFSDLSSGNGSFTHSWDFGDGFLSNLSNPMHVYANAGTYLVCLTVADLCGSDTHCDSVTILCPVPTPWFTFSQQGGGLTVFNNTSAGMPSAVYAWDFGDGNSSSVQNPSHTYSGSGTYLACLSITDSCGTASVCDTVVVQLVAVQGGKENLMRIRPNPASFGFSLFFDDPPSERGEITLLDVRGKTVLSRRWEEGVSALEIETDGLAEGIYLVRYEGGSVRTFGKLMIKR